MLVMLPLPNSRSAELNRETLPTSVAGADPAILRMALAELLPSRLIVPAFDKPAAVTVVSAVRPEYPMWNEPVLVLVSVPPIVSVLPEEAPKSTPTVPLLLSPPVTASVPPGSAITKIADEDVNEI